MRAILCSVLLLMLAACAGGEKGAESGWGFDALNTTSKEQKDEDKWFGSFYGSKHCVWGSGNCSGGDSGGSDSGTGGFWGVGPDGASGHSN